MAIATSNFLSATDATYAQLCMEYKIAIQNQIDTCGDSDGALQAILTSLGDCQIDNPQPNNCQDAINLSLAAQMAYSNAVETNFTQLCNAYKTALENQITICGDDDGSIQATIDSLGDCQYVEEMFYVEIDGVEFHIHFLMQMPFQHLM